MTNEDMPKTVSSTPSRINVSELRRCAEYTAQWRYFTQDDATYEEHGR